MSNPIDMSAFEQQFAADRLSPNMDDETFTRMSFLRDRISDLEGVMDLRREAANSLLGGYEEIIALEKRIEALLKKIRARRIPLDEERTRLNREIRQDDATLDTLKREWARLMAELDARRRMMIERNLIEDRTKNAPWRIGLEDGTKALPHQIEGAHRLTSAERAILGDKPGLGKTLQAIMTIDMLRAKGKANKVLIFTPKAVLKDFESEFHKWSPGQFVHILNHAGKGTKSMILDVIQHMEECIIITNYEVWRKDKTILDKFKTCQFDTIILDEAHVLKTGDSATTKGIRSVVYAENQCPSCKQNVVKQRYSDTMCGVCETVAEKIGDFCSIKQVIPMSGTTILNKPQELWALLNLIDRIGFPDEKSFLRDYCHQEYNYGLDRYVWTFGSGGAERLLRRLGLRYTARTRDSAGVKMPPQEIKHHRLELDPEKYPRHHKFVQVLKEKARLAFGDAEMTALETLAWYTRMRQAASWPDGIRIKGCAHDPVCMDEEGNEKCYSPSIVFPPEGAPPVGESVIMDGATDIVADAVESGDRIVVFSHFKACLAELKKRCDELGFRAVVFSGDTPDRARQGIIDDFNANRTTVGEHKYDILLCQYQTGSVGLNLHGAQQLLCIEREWNPGKEEQAIDRLRRIDSKYESTVHILHAEGTATDLIDALMDQKKALLDGFEADVNLQEAMRKFLEG